jgi:uncharacterized protein YcbK (DUF882 family)
MPTQLTPHFTLEELACKCGCKTPVAVRFRLEHLAPILEKIRANWGHPVTVNCAYRCPAHNAAVGGVSDSQHIHGNAADIKIHGVTPEEIAEFAATMPEVGGLGVYPTQNFCHVDQRVHPRGEIARWQG